MCKISKRFIVTPSGNERILDVTSQGAHEGKFDSGVSLSDRHQILKQACQLVFKEDNTGVTTGFLRAVFDHAFYAGDLPRDKITESRKNHVYSLKWGRGTKEVVSLSEARACLEIIK